MKWVFIPALMFGSVMNVGAQATKDGQFWIPVDVKWTRIQGAPRDVKTRTASTVVLYFGRDGEFVRDECWLVRNGKSIAISNGEPHTQYVGRVTEPMLDGMKITYRLVRRTVERAGEVLPGPEKSETASTMAKSGLAIEGQFFRPVNLANARDYVEVYSTLGQQYAQQ